MTDLATSPTRSVAPRRTRASSIVALGALRGLTLGIAARSWMRLIAEDPEFTWNGTLFILSGFTIFGLGHAVADAARRRDAGRRALMTGRAFGMAGTMPLFVAAGAVMLPTVVAGTLGLARGEWRRSSRAVCFAVALLPVLFVSHQLVDSFGWSLHAAAGLLGLLLLYSAVIAVARPALVRQDAVRRAVPMTGALRTP